MSRKGYISSRSFIVVVALASAATLASLVVNYDVAESTEAPQSGHSMVQSVLFSGAPDYSAVAREARERAARQEPTLLADGEIEEAEYLAQARRTAECVAEALGAATSDPVLRNGRAHWTISIDDRRRGPSQEVVAPSEEVARVSEDCHEKYLGDVERAWLASTMPQGDDWHALRSSFLQCLNVGEDVAAVASALFGDPPAPETRRCVVEHQALFETLS